MIFSAAERTRNICTWYRSTWPASRVSGWAIWSSWIAPLLPHGAREGLAKGALLQRITDFVLAQQRNGRRVLLIVDEAQNLPWLARVTPAVGRERPRPDIALLSSV